MRKIWSVALKEKISGEVRFDNGSRALYATDSSNYRQIPIGVVVPKTIDDVVQTISVCREFSAPVLSRGGGTSLAGQCCNVAVVLDFSKYLHKILELNPQEKFARIEPGIVLDDLRAEAEKHHLTFAPDPSTHNHCTLGGMIGNNSCGVHSVMAGKTVENIEELEILTYDGLRMRVGKTSDEELEKIIREGGRRGEIYSASEKFARQICRFDPPKISENSAPRFRLQFGSTSAGKWFQRCARARRHGRHLRHRARSESAACSQPAVSRALSRSVIRRFTKRAITSWKCSRTNRSASKVSTTCSRAT